METVTYQTYDERNMVEDLVMDLDRRGYITFVLAVGKINQIKTGSGLGQLFLEKRPDIFTDFSHFANENLKGMVIMNHDVLDEGQDDEEIDEEIMDEVLEDCMNDDGMDDEGVDDEGLDGEGLDNEDEENHDNDGEMFGHSQLEEFIVKEEPNDITEGYFQEENYLINHAEGEILSAEDIASCINNESFASEDGNHVKPDIEVLKVDSSHIPTRKLDQEEAKAVKFNNKVEIITMNEKIKSGSSKKGAFHCDKCGQQFEFLHSLETHKNRKMSCIDETVFKCEKMDKEIITYKDINGTLKVMTASTALKILKKECILCPYTNKRPSNVKRHFFVNHCKTKPFKCDFCDESYKMEYYLNKHLMMAHANLNFEPFKCERCGKELASEKSLKSHELFKCAERDRNVVCKICKYTAKTTTQLKEHEMTHTGEKPINCPICAKKFFTERTLKVHLEIHSTENNYQCKICGLTFRTRRQRYIHTKGHTRVKSRHDCDICNKSFEHETSLKNHMYTHSDVKPYVCEFCGEGFIVKGRLLAHVQLHNGGSQFQCQICFKSFPKHGALKTHSLIHEERGYTCDRCGKSFHRRGQLTQHYKKHTDRHDCEYCDAKFGVQADLNKHIKDEHFEMSHTASTDAIIESALSADGYEID